MLICQPNNAIITQYINWQIRMVPKRWHLLPNNLIKFASWNIINLFILHGTCFIWILKHILKERCTLWYDILNMQRMQRTDKWKKIACCVYWMFILHTVNMMIHFIHWNSKYVGSIELIARKNMKFPTFYIVEMYFSFVACFEGQTRMERPTCCVN